MKNGSLLTFLEGFLIDVLYLKSLERFLSLFEVLLKSGLFIAEFLIECFDPMQHAAQFLVKAIILAFAVDVVTHDAS